MHGFKLADIQGLADRGQIDGLPARHAARAAGHGQRVYHPESLSVVGGDIRIMRQDMKGQRLQRVAGQHRGRLIIGHMAGWPPAPEFIIVHGRQVIMDQ